MNGFKEGESDGKSYGETNIKVRPGWWGWYGREWHFLYLTQHPLTKSLFRRESRWWFVVVVVGVVAIIKIFLRPCRQRSSFRTSAAWTDRAPWCWSTARGRSAAPSQSPPRRSSSWRGIGASNPFPSASARRSPCWSTPPVSWPSPETRTNCWDDKDQKSRLFAKLAWRVPNNKVSGLIPCKGRRVSNQ